MYPSLAMPAMNPGKVLNLLFWTIASHSGVQSVYSTTFIPFWVWVTLPSFTLITIVFHSPTGFTLFGSAASMSYNDPARWLGTLLSVASTLSSTCTSGAA